MPMILLESSLVCSAFRAGATGKKGSRTAKLAEFLKSVDDDIKQTQHGLKTLRQKNAVKKNTTAQPGNHTVNGGCHPHGLIENGWREPAMRQVCN